MTYSYDPRPRQPSRLAFDVSRIVVDAGVLLVLGSMSLPFVTAEAFRQRAVAGDALPALLLVLPVFLMTLLPDQARPLPAPLSWVSLGLAAAALPYTVVKYLDASTLAGTLQGSVGMGARVLVMGVFVVIVGLVLGLLRRVWRAPAADPYPAEEAAPAPDPARAVSPAARSRVPQPQAATPAGVPAGTGRPGGPHPSPIPTGRSFPRWRRPGAAAKEAPAGPSSPPPAASRPPARVPSRPRPTDPDTEPTLPAQRPIQPWWPDDLEDLFS